MVSVDVKRHVYCPLLGVLFFRDFFSLVCFMIYKDEQVLFVLVQETAISWPLWVWGWARDRFLPFTVVVFSFCLPFCFSSYIVHLRCTSEGGSLDV